MAAPTIDGSNTYGANSSVTTHTVPLPTSGVAMASYSLIVFPITRARQITNGPALAGWTVVGISDVSWAYANGNVLSLAYKYAGSSESDPTFTLPERLFCCGCLVWLWVAWTQPQRLR